MVPKTATNLTELSCHHQSSTTAVTVMDNQADMIDTSLDPLVKFEQRVTTPLPEALLPLPSDQNLNQVAVMPEEHGRKDKQKQATRCSPRIKGNAKKRKPAIKLVQEVLAKKWGILDIDKEMEDLTLQ
jgi:hypothetical protein